METSKLIKFLFDILNSKEYTTLDFVIKRSNKFVKMSNIFVNFDDTKKADHIFKP